MAPSAASAHMQQQQQQRWWPVALAGVALAAGVYRLLSTVTSFTPYWTALTSDTLAMSSFERVGAVFPLKWEDTLYCFLLSFGAWNLLLVTVLAIAATTPAPATAAAAAAAHESSADKKKETPPPVIRNKAKAKPAAALATRSHRPLPALLVHVAFLAFQAWMETYHKEQLHAQYLCTWSWWAAGAYAVLCLATADNVNAPTVLPLTMVAFPAAMGLIVWTHVSYLRILPTYPVQNLLHIMPFIYYTVANRIDDRYRPPVPLWSAALAAQLSGLIPMLALYIYGQIFDYRDIYSAFFEMYGMSSWWPSLETTLMSTTAIVVGHMFYGYGSSAAGTRRRRAVNMALILAAAVAVPVTVLIIQPVRLHHMRNCPPEPINLAYLDKTTGALTLNETTTAHLRATVLAPLYVHAITGPSHDARAIADGYLSRIMVSPVLEPLCLPPTVPSSPGDIWVRTVPLPFTHPLFRARVIAENYAASRVGTLLILYADAVTDTALNATAALLALTPSVVYYMDDVPTAADLARLDAISRAAVELRAACPPAKCVLVDPNFIAANVAMEKGMQASNAAPPTPLGELTIVIKHAMPELAAATADFNRTTFLLQQLEHGPTASLASHYARLGMFELGHDRTPPAEYDALVQGSAPFARWGPYPFLLQQFSNFIPPVEATDALDAFITALATVIHASNAAAATTVRVP